MYVTIERPMEEKIEILRLDDTNTVFMHYHNFLEIAYVISGDASHQIGEKTGKIRRGNYFVVDYHTPHHYLSPRSDLTIINCLFLPEFIDPSFSDASSFNELCERYYFRESGRLINGPASNIVFEDDGTVGRIFMRMHEEYTAKKEGYLPLLKCLLSQVILETIRKIGSNGALTQRYLPRAGLQPAIYQRKIPQGDRFYLYEIFTKPPNRGGLPTADRNRYEHNRNSRKMRLR